MTLTPERAAQLGRIGSHSRWAHEPDRVAATQPARDGFMAKFERQVDPDGLLTPQERAFRAEHAMKAHMARIASKKKP